MEEADDDLALFRDAVEALAVSNDLLDGIPAGWRLERNSDGQWRLRWQVKDEAGEPVKYITSTGKVGYKRGSRYVNKRQAEQLRTDG